MIRAVIVWTLVSMLLPMRVSAVSRTYALADGYNFIALTVDPEPAADSAATLLANPFLQQIFRFDPATRSFKYQIRAGGGSPFGEPFPLAGGEGYVIRSDGPGTLAFSGALHSAGVAAELARGLNFVGFPPLKASPRASDLLSGNPSVRSVFAWDSPRRRFGFMLKLNERENFGEDWTLEEGTGYFILADAEATVVFGEAAADPRAAANLSTIRGYLTEAGFQPAAGPSASGAPGRAPLRAPLAGVVVTIPGTAWTAVTDAAGQFVIPNVTAGTWSIYAKATVGGEVLAFYRENVVAVAGQTVDLGGVALRSTVGVSGRITSSGAALPGALVHLVGDVITDGAGGYAFADVPYGAHTLTVSKAGFNPQTLPVTVDRTPVVVDVALTATSATVGSVTVSADHVGAAILIDGVNTGQVTDATVDNVPTGFRSIQVRLAGFQTPVPQVLNISAGVTVAAAFNLLPDVALPPTGQAGGTVAAETVPLSGIVLYGNTLYPVAGATVGVDGTPTVTDAAGRFTSAPFELGLHAIAVTKAGFTPLADTVQFASGGASGTFEIVMNPPAVLSGTVRDTQGNPIDGALVSILNPDGTATPYSAVTAGAAGYALSGPPLGNVTVKVADTASYTGVVAVVSITPAGAAYNPVLNAKPLNAPTGFRATNTIDHATFSWTARTEATLLGYKIYVRDPDTLAYSSIAPQLIPKTDTSYSYYQIPPNVRIYFKMSSVNIDGIEGAMGGSWNVLLGSKNLTAAGGAFAVMYMPIGSAALGAVSQGSALPDADEAPTREVAFANGNWIGATEVTQKQWRAVMGTSPAVGYGVGDDYPVYNVSWNDVQDFITRLNGSTATGSYRLPTEAEWEYACRANSTTAYYWGNETDDNYLWHDANSGGASHPVGLKTGNDWGLKDMSGNVWEWCSDWYDKDYYRTTAPTDPQGPATGAYKVIRGGSWSYVERTCRSSDRNGRLPAQKYNNVGFRLVYVE